MFRIALPSSYKHQWQMLIEQYSDLFNTQHQLYQCTTEGDWLPLLSKNNGAWLLSDTQSHWQATAAHVLNQARSQASYPLSNSLKHLSENTAFWTTPIWFPDGSLFSVIVTLDSTGNINESQLTAWLDIIAGKIGYDLINLQNTHGQQLPSLQEFLDGLADHAWVKNTQGEYIICNRAVENAWGVDITSIIGAEDHQLFSNEIAAKFLQADEYVIQTDQQLIVEECSGMSENGEGVWLETIKSPVKNRDGELLGVLGMTRNVTRRKSIENQLKVTAKIFNNSHEGMMITDHHGNLIEVNKSFSKITGYQTDEVLGRNPRLLKSGLQCDNFYKTMWQTLKELGQWKGELSNRRKDGTIYPQRSTITAVMGKNDELLNYLCIFEDITSHKVHEQKLEKMAFYDPLTDLPNRSHIVQLLAQQIKTGEPFATLFLDIDHFKHINDSLGHHCGDEVLVELALRLKETTSSNNHVARIGGDEFVIVVTDLTQPDTLNCTINQVLELFRSPFHPNDSQPLHLSTSIGVSHYPQDGEDTDTLLKNADTAMYLAKKNGRNGYAFYSPELTNESKSHVRFHSALHQAIKNEEFHLAYQPQFNLETGHLIGLEALLRWHNPSLGNIGPDQFIPIAEKTGLINELGAWVLESACRQGKEWLDSGYNFSKIAVNVSAIQLQQKDFTRHLTEILDHTQFPAHCLEIEITEGYLMRDPTLATHDLNRLKALGIEISLDDFGTGYSSLSYLKGLPLDKIKVDRSFIHDIPQDNDSVAIVSAIIAMAASLNLKVIAEGIECYDQQQHLIEHGCTHGQGFYLSYPLNPKLADEKEVLVSLFSRTK